MLSTKGGVTRKLIQRLKAALMKTTKGETKMERRRRTTSLGLALLSVMVGVMAVAVLLWAVGSAGASPPMKPLAQGGAPLLLNYQGRLADPATSLPKPDGPYTITFKIHDAETGGSLIWSETQVVTVTRGLFNMLLGSGTALSASDFAGTSRWLELEVEGETLSPRMRFGSVPYAIQAEEAKNAWRLTGNAGTNPTTNFLGTTDAVSLTLAVSDTVALRLVPAADAPNLIGGYTGNSVTGGVSGATIGGGGGTSSPLAPWASGPFPNTVTGSYATVSGGALNTASDVYATVGGGWYNIASGTSSTVGGGGSNTASGFGATISGGGGNTAEGEGATIGGGGGSTASADHATVGGGYLNHADAQAATIAGGEDIRVTNDYAAVGGGQHNTASGDYATIGGGYGNTASYHRATVGGGWSNTASGYNATVGGGDTNTASGSNATVGGGYRNTASYPRATVGGGWSNSASGDSATIGGGDTNNASGWSATIGGGDTNTASGWWATIGGGSNNTASDYSVTIGGGSNNTASDRFPTIGGGLRNNASGWSATIGGGQNNQATADYATIAGGGSDTAGNGNRVTDDYGTVGGGANNQAGDNNGTSSDRTYATVGGGSSNTASGGRATIGGGKDNTASGSCSTIAGGCSSSAVGDFSFAAGQGAKALHQGAFVWASSGDGDFSSERDGQFKVQAPGGAKFHDDVGNWVELLWGQAIKTSAGAYLSYGGTWTNASDAALKQGFAPVDNRGVLRKLVNMPISTWSYRTEDANVRHLGPTGQDFYATFGLGDSDKAISTVDADGVALAAIQALAVENVALRQQLDDLEARVAALEAASASSTASAQPLQNGLLPGAGVLLAGLGLVWINRRGGALSLSKGGRR